MTAVFVNETAVIGVVDLIGRVPTLYVRSTVLDDGIDTGRVRMTVEPERDTLVGVVVAPPSMCTAKSDGRGVESDVLSDGYVRVMVFVVNVFTVGMKVVCGAVSMMVIYPGPTSPNPTSLPSMIFVPRVVMESVYITPVNMVETLLLFSGSMTYILLSL